MDLVCSDPAHMVTAFTNGRMGIFNMETRQLVLELESQAAGKPGTSEPASVILLLKIIFFSLLMFDVNLSINLNKRNNNSSIMSEYKSPVMLSDADVFDVQMHRVRLIKFSVTRRCPSPSQHRRTDTSDSSTTTQVTQKPTFLTCYLFMHACLYSHTLIFFSGKLIHSMVAHLDAVTSLAVDPNGLYLMSGSKYSRT